MPKKTKVESANFIPEAVLPIQNVEELIDLVLQFDADESAWDIETVERILDGVARLHSERWDDFDRRMKPIRKLIYSFGPGLENIITAWSVRRKTTKNGSQTFDESDDLFKNIGSLKEAAMISASFSKKSEQQSTDFFKARCSLLAERIGQFKVLPLLSTPTHRGCMIDPVEFVNRLFRQNDTLLEYDAYDKTLALFRLGNWNRKEALLHLKKSKQKFDEPEYVDAVRYALGSEKVKIGLAIHYWAAASRCRFPESDDPVVAKVHPKLGVGTIKMPEYTHLMSYGRIDGTYRDGYLEPWTKEAKMPAPAAAYPSVLYYRTELHRSFGMIGAGFLHSLWPSNPWPFYRKAAIALANEINATSTHCLFHSSNLEIMLNQVGPLKREGGLLLAVGLAAAQPSISGMAVDVAIRCIEQDRVTPNDIALGCKEMLRFLNSEESQSLKKLPKGMSDHQVKPTRWAKLFKIVAQESAQHSAFIRSCIDLILQSIPSRDQSVFLEMLYDLSLETKNSDLSDSTRQFLIDFAGSGKAAKLAKKLLEL